MKYELPGRGQALFTSCAHGNLSTRRGDGHEQGRATCNQLADELGLSWLCTSRQVHGSTVQRVRVVAGSRGEAVPIDADGHATALVRVGMMVLTADCLPVALGAETDRGGAVVAIAHAGWRGLAAGVAEVTHADTCTICDERFFSHRRQGKAAGRQGGIAWVG